MNNAVYITLSRGMGVYRSMDHIADNIANSNTNGYKAENTIFSDYIFDTKNNESFSYTVDVGIARDLANGSFTQTSGTFDLAIHGPGYFMVDTPLGKRYTRDGNFHKGNEGYLVSLGGDRVLDKDGKPIAIEDTAKKIEVRENGKLVVDDNEITTIGMVEFEDQRSLSRAGKSYFKADSTPIDALHSRMMQGAVENSNVSAIMEMNRMIDHERSFSNSMSILQSLNELSLTTIRKLGKNN